jgi:hypothetical protein
VPASPSMNTWCMAGVRVSSGSETRLYNYALC